MTSLPAQSPALVGLIRIVSTNPAAGRYVSRTLGATGVLTATDSYVDALKVRINPQFPTSTIEVLNSTNGLTFLGGSQEGAYALGKDSSEWATLTTVSGPNVNPPQTSFVNAKGVTHSDIWNISIDGTIRPLWEDAGSVYALQVSVETGGSRRIYLVSNPAAYNAYYYKEDPSRAALVRLVFESSS